MNNCEQINKLWIISNNNCFRILSTACFYQLLSILKSYNIKVVILNTVMLYYLKVAEDVDNKATHSIADSSSSKLKDSTLANKVANKSLVLFSVVIDIPP